MRDFARDAYRQRQDKTYKDKQKQAQNIQRHRDRLELIVKRPWSWGGDTEREESLDTDKDVERVVQRIQDFGARCVPALEERLPTL